MKIVKEIFDENGLPAALVRLNDTESCIDFTYDYITEFDSFPRACEEEAVARFEGGLYDGAGYMALAGEVATNKEEND